MSKPNFRLLLAASALAGLSACLELESPATEAESFELSKKPKPGGPGGTCATVSSTFDVVVPRVQVSGDFRINGAVPSAVASQTGIVELRSDTLGVVELGSVFEGSYSRWVIPGTYQVIYRHVEGNLVPQNAESIVIDEVDLSATSTLNIDIASMLAMGDITLNGAPPPVGFYEQGQLRFRDRATGEDFPVGSSLDGDYFAMVMPGVYDLVWSRVAGGAAVPANEDAVLLEEVTVDGLLDLDVDIPAVVRTGDIRIDGALPPTGFYENGRVLLRDNQTGDLIALGDTRDLSYSKMVVPGTYDILYSNILGSTQVPANELALLASDVVFDVDGDLLIDIPTVNISGALSLDGAGFPISAYNSSRFWLQGPEEADRFIIANNSASTYQVRVIPGTYDVAYENLASSGMVPANPWAVISRKRSVSRPRNRRSTSATLDIDVSSGWLAAEVTLWGQPTPAGFYEVGEISAVNSGGALASLGTTHEDMELRLVSGSYDFRYRNLIGTILPANTDAPVGQGSTGLLGILTPIDLQPGTLAGDFIQGAHPFPVSAYNHGTIALRDSVTGDQFVLGDTSDSTYQLGVLGGTYKVVYDYAAGTSVVANKNAEIGCITFEPPAPIVLP